jgi:hypothetical protein
MNNIKYFVIATTIGIVGLTTTALPAFASNDPKNGWGEATSEEAAEEKEGQELGEHASDPNNDGPGNDERRGLGNLAHPDDLGKLLDCVDQDDEDDPDPNDC